MTKSEVYAVLNEIFNNVFMREDIEIFPEMTTADLVGWDSFKQIEIIMAAEERFGIKLTTREIDNLETVGNLTNTICSKLSIV